MKMDKKLSIMSVAMVIITALILTLTNVYKSDQETKDLYTETAEKEYNMINGFMGNKFSGDWNVQSGTLYLGEKKAEDLSGFIDNIYSNDNVYMSICNGSERIATSVTDKSGKSVKGTSVKDEIAKKVLAGEIVNGIETVNDRVCAVAYHPIKDKSGKAVGIYYVGIDASSIAKSRSEMIRNNVISVLILSILAIIAVHFILKLMLKPLSYVEKQMVKMSNKDFTKEEHIDSIHSKDEVGNIAEACRAMVKTISGMVGIIVDNSESIAEIADHTEDNMNKLGENVEETVATTEQISAGMEETTASVEQINASVENIKDMLGKFNENAEVGNNRADEIKKRALSIMENATARQAKAKELLELNSAKVESAIEKSKSINEIEQLADSISGIAGQTKLLALNATIEASRAGEAGRGFNVVAQEIQKLSLESTNAVTKIQEIVSGAVESVKDLITVTGKITEYMNTDVMGILTELVETGNSYNADSDYMDQFTTTLSERSTELLDDMNNIVEAMNAISITVAENAQGNTGVAESATDISAKTQEVLGMTEKLKEHSDSLSEYVGDFQY